MKTVDEFLDRWEQMFTPEGREAVEADLRALLSAKETRTGRLVAHAGEQHWFCTETGPGRKSSIITKVPYSDISPLLPVETIIHKLIELCYFPEGPKQVRLTMPSGVTYEVDTAPVLRHEIVTSRVDWDATKPKRKKKVAR